MGGHLVWDGPKALAATATPVMSVAACPVIAYRQGGVDLCAAYGLASALHFFGDASAAAAIAACARAALASGDAFGHMRMVVRSQAAGWSEVPLAQHDSLATRITEPVHLQLVGSDGAGSPLTPRKSARSRCRVPRSTAVWACTSTAPPSRMWREPCASCRARACASGCGVREGMRAEHALCI